MQSMVMAVLIGGTFFQIGDDQESRVKRLPVLFFCTVGAQLPGSDFDESHHDAPGRVVMCLGACWGEVELVVVAAAH